MYERQNDRRPDSQPREKFGPFFDKDGSLILDWVGKKAEKTSRDICSAQNGLTATGLRNFFNEFLRIKGLPAEHKEEKIVLVKLLIAKVNYKKLNKKAPEIFARFITELVEEIGDSLDKFEKACMIMEAIVGFNPKE